MYFIHLFCANTFYALYLLLYVLCLSFYNLILLGSLFFLYHIQKSCSSFICSTCWWKIKYDNFIFTELYFERRFFRIFHETQRVQHRSIFKENKKKPCIVLTFHIHFVSLMPSLFLMDYSMYFPFEQDSQQYFLVSAAAQKNTKK